MGSALLNRWTDPLYSPVRGKFIFRLGAYGKSSSSRWTYGSKTGAAYPSDRQRTAAAAGKKNVKEELLKLDTKQVYDEQMKEQLDQALSYEYPYLEDTGLYTQMSVSELKNRVRSGVKKKISEQNERTCPKSDWTTNMKWNRKAVKQKMAKTDRNWKERCIQRNGLSPCLRMSGSACCYRPEKTGRGSVRPVSARLSYRRSL